MTWPAKTYVAGELMTATLANAYWRDPQTDLRAGGIAISGQSANDFIFATSSTQLGRLAAVPGQVPRWTGSAWEMTHPLGMAYPVGYLFKSVVATNPSTLLGFGTWEIFGAGRVMVAVDSGDGDFDTAEETGGAKTHTLSIAEMPSHTHTQNAHNHNISGVGTVRSVGQTDLDVSVLDNAGSLTSSGTVAVNQNTGGGNAHNNLMPYFVGYVWKRVA